MHEQTQTNVQRSHASYCIFTRTVLRLFHSRFLQDRYGENRSRFLSLCRDRSVLCLLIVSSKSMESQTRTVYGKVGLYLYFLRRGVLLRSSIHVTRSERNGVQDSVWSCSYGTFHHYPRSIITQNNTHLLKYNNEQVLAGAYISFADHIELGRHSLVMVYIFQAVRSSVGSYYPSRVVL